MLRWDLVVVLKGIMFTATEIKDWNSLLQAPEPLVLAETCTMNFCIHWLFFCLRRSKIEILSCRLYKLEYLKRHKYILFLCFKVWCKWFRSHWYFMLYPFSNVLWCCIICRSNIWKDFNLAIIRILAVSGLNNLISYTYICFTKAQIILILGESI